MGVYGTLVTMLSGAAPLSGVYVRFGEEAIADESSADPRVVIVPLGGAVTPNGYQQAGDPDDENRWSIVEQAEIWCGAWSSSAGAQPVDHADAVDDLRRRVLSALAIQRYSLDPATSAIYGGLWWAPVSGRWERFGDSVMRYGRAYVLTVQVELTVTDYTTFTDATVTSVALSQSI